MSEQEYAPGMIIVKLSSDDHSTINTFLNSSGASSFERVFPTMTFGKPDPYRLSAIYQLKFPPDADITSIIRQYEGNPVVEYAQPNYLNRPASENAPDDFFYEDQWALPVIDVPDAWKIEKGR